MRRGVLALVGIALTFFGRGYAAPVGGQFTYQGRLMQSGEPVQGARDLTFRLFDDPIGGAMLGTQTIVGVMVTKGNFSVVLNDAGQFGANPFQGEARWIEIEIGGTPLAPRQQLNAVPYAVHAANAASATSAQSVPGIDGHSLDSADGSLIDALFVDAQGRVGIGTTTPSSLFSLRRADNGTDLLIAPGFRDTTASGGWTTFDVNGSPTPSFRFRDAVSVAGTLAINDLGPPADTQLFVRGNLETEGLRLRQNGQSGRVLTSDAEGNATWQDSLWSQNGANIFNTYPGNVGIGTSNPSAKLVVRGGGGPTSLLVAPGYLDGTQTANAVTLDIPGFSTLRVWDNLSVSERLGVGVTSPQSRLHVGGTPGTDGIVFPDNTKQVTAAGLGGLQEFDAVGTHNWVAPAGVHKTMIELWGGCGGGGYGGPQIASTSAGGGGGAGGYSRMVVSVVPGQTYQVIIAAGGLAGTATSRAGTAGGNTIFQAADGLVLCYVTGGGGGGGGTTGAPSQPGGAGGAGGAPYPAAGVKRTGRSGSSGSASSDIGPGGAPFFPGIQGTGGEGYDGTVEPPHANRGGDGSGGTNRTAAAGTPGYAILNW